MRFLMLRALHGWALALACFAPSVYAAPTAAELPSGGRVTSGQASIAVDGAHMEVNQASQNASLDWQTFNVGRNAEVEFHQPDASAVAVNRIADVNGSRILGRVDANGQVYLINPNGVLFGRNAQVDVGGLVASTLDIADADAASNKRSFSISPLPRGEGPGVRASGDEAAVVNQGTITTSDGGYVALLGGRVSNQGVIQARLGTVALAAGDKVTLDFAGDKLLGVQVDKGALRALAENRQLIQADGGSVLLTAKAADGLIQTVVNNEGVIEAHSIEDHSGVIKLLGDMDHGTVKVAGTLDASAGAGKNTDGGLIDTSAARVHVAAGAHVTAAARRGATGTWRIDAGNYTIAAEGGDIDGATLSASLAGSNVEIRSTAGNGDVSVDDAVAWSANTLTLTAARHIHVNQRMTAAGSSTLVMNTGVPNAGVKLGFALGGGFAGRIDFGSRSGKGLLFIDGESYTVIDSLGTAGSTTGADLQGINGALGNKYALGADIDAGGLVGLLGHNSTLLNGYVGSDQGFTVSGTGYVGGLVGGSMGAVSNAYVLHGLLSNAQPGYADAVGGLAGFNSGTISHSYGADVDSHGLADYAPRRP
ncbi:MAG: filamentous hemagglutinin N-terminal domain-containing protein [Methylococcaceae bacterium]|nr:MAG: filamentous hemagglutinin N-terminal domain-containing protein [Methylococcaceae bacterium]